MLWQDVYHEQNPHPTILGIQGAYGWEMPKQGAPLAFVVASIWILWGEWRTPTPGSQGPGDRRQLPMTGASVIEWESNGHLEGGQTQKVKPL